MNWLLAVLLLGARAAPEDALDPFLRRLYAQGLDHERQGRFEAAALQYRAVLSGDGSWKQAVVALGRVLERSGREEEALEVYEVHAPYDADAVEALGELQLALDRPVDALATFRKLGELRPGWPKALVLQADALSRTGAEAASLRLLEYLERSAAELDVRVVEVIVRVASDLWTDGQQEAALTLLGSLEARFPAVAGIEAVEALRVEFEVEETARTLAEAAGQPLSAQQSGELSRARERFAAGDAEGAVALLEAVLVVQPRSAVAWATLADVRLALGDVLGADQAIRVAVRLAPLEASYVARQADILSEGFGGRFDEDAAEAWARAARLRPRDPELWHRKALAERRAGWAALAAASMQQVVALDPDGEHAAHAARVIEGASRERLPDVVLPEAPGRPADVPEDGWLAFHRAWAWRERGDRERALVEVEAARRAAPSFVRALELEATIRVDRDEVDRAVVLYQQVLDADPGADHTMVDLALLQDRLGNRTEAEALWERAASAGNSSALWRRAVQQARAGRWWTARATLAEYFERTSGAPSYEQARALDRQLRARIRAAWGASGALVLFGVGLPIWARSRRRGGVGLRELLACSPGSAREVARVCAVLRHEVLKHHTSVLGVVADALEDPDPGPARWAAERLFGPDGALARLDAYVAEIEAVGRQAGVRLNLRHRDPTFAPLLQAVDRLRSLRVGLERGEDRRLAGPLREISDELNGRAYRALGRLVAGLQVLELDAATLCRIYGEVVAEPAFRDARVPTLALEPLPDERLLLRLYPPDLRDILVNLLRNSVDVSVADGAERLGLAVEIDEDEITGLERVAIRVRDDSPRKLTTQMIRGRYISRGLGLAVDLTSRAGGSIHVEREPGWSKAVVVRLPRAEVVDEEGA